MKLTREDIGKYYLAENKRVYQITKISGQLFNRPFSVIDFITGETNAVTINGCEFTGFESAWPPRRKNSLWRFVREISPDKEPQYFV
jgi:hypothetical protein